MARPYVDRMMDRLLLQLMIWEVERQLADGQQPDFKAAAKAVTPILNNARLSGSICTRTVREAHLMGDAVRQAMKQANVAGRGMYLERRKKEIAALRKPVRAWQWNTVLARFNKLRDKDDPACRRLRERVADLDRLDRILARLCG
jgi:hypothetical protein